MSNEYRWLVSQIPLWVTEGLITPEQGARIRARYQTAPTAQASLSWGLIVFFALGAIVVGLGVILLLAYNWSGIPKVGKLALVFGSVIAAHGAGLMFRRRDDWRVMLGEGMHVLGTMLFGAGIWLVAQIYNIDEHFPTGFFVWGLGALALAWAIPSIPQGIIAAIVLATWGVVEVAEFGNTVDWAVVLLAGGLGALAWRARSAILAAVVLAAVYVQVLSHAAHWGGSSGAFTSAMAISVVLVALAEWVRDHPAAGRAPAVLRFYGLTGFVVCAYALTFVDGARGLLRLNEVRADGLAVAMAYRWVLFAGALALWALVFYRDLARRRRPPALESWFYPLGLACVIAATMLDLLHDGALIALVFNLILLAVSALWIVNGCREGRLRRVVLGSILLGLLVFARYFDLFDSLAARGLAFVLFGAALFAEGFFYRKLRLERAGDTGGAP